MPKKTKRMKLALVIEWDEARDGPLPKHPTTGRRMSLKDVNQYVSAKETYGSWLGLTGPGAQLRRIVKAERDKLECSH